MLQYGYSLITVLACAAGCMAGWRELPPVWLLLVRAGDASPASLLGPPGVPQLPGTLQAVHDCSSAVLLPSVTLPLL